MRDQGCREVLDLPAPEVPVAGDSTPAQHLGADHTRVARDRAGGRPPLTEVLLELLAKPTDQLAGIEPAVEDRQLVVVVLPLSERLGPCDAVAVAGQSRMFTVLG